MPKEQLSQDPNEELEQYEDEAPEEQYEDEQDQPQAPVMVRIRLNGKTVEVPEDVADAIQAREADFQRQISKMGTELGQLRRQPREERPEPQASPEDEDLEFFQSPSKAVERRLRQAEERAYQRAQEDNARREAQREFWGTFYQTNADLKDHGEVVQFVLNKHFEDLKEMSPVEAQRELATRTKAFLGVKSQGKPLPKGQAQTERPANPTPPSRPKRQEDPSKPEYKGFGREVARQAEIRRKALYHASKEDND